MVTYIVIVCLIGMCLANLVIVREGKGNPYIEGFLFSILGSIGYQSTYSQPISAIIQNQLKSTLILSMIFYLVYIGIYALSSKYLVQVYFTVIMSICMIGNKMKFISRGEIVVWSDFKTGLVKDVVWGMVLQKYWWLLLIAILILVVSSFYIIKKKPHTISLKKRSINLFISMGVLGLFLSMPTDILLKMGCIIYPNNNAENLKINGPGLVFFISKNGTIMAQPEGYSQQRMEEVIGKIKKKYPSNKIAEDKPTFIYILSEAFSDPTSFEGTEWKEDPIPTIRQLQKENGGKLLVDVFGGGTANTEYSVLSNFSHSLLNTGALPYSYIYENPGRNSSEISLFNQLGYETSALHPYFGSSYNRKDVFKSLGFEKFTTIDDMKNETWSEGWISDDNFFKDIIKQLTDGPQMIHGISMQNHYDYTVERKGKLEKQDSLLLNQQDIPSGDQLAMYARGIHKTDMAVEMFLKNLKDQDKEVYVVFYGDHFPALDNSLYENVKLTTHSNQDIAKFLTPYFIWNNKGKKMNTPPIVNTEFLTTPALTKSGIELPAFYQFVADLNKQLPAFNLEKDFLIEHGKEVASLSPKTKEMLEEYQLIMYDRLSGNNYSEKLFNISSKNNQSANK